MTTAGFLAGLLWAVVLVVVFIRSSTDSDKKNLL